MTVDVESLTMPEFLMLLAWEGNPPDDPAFDNIRMTPEEWRTMFPGAVQQSAPDAETEETDAGDAAPAPAPRAPAADGPAAAGGEEPRAVPEAPAPPG